MEIFFRKATPEDAEKIIPLMYSAAPDMLEFSYTTKSKKAEEFLNYCYKKGKGFFGYKVQLAGEINYDIVISATVYSGKEVIRLSLETLFLVISFYGWQESFQLLKKTVSISTLFEKPGTKSCYIGNLGVKKELRGKGIAKEFFKFIHARANTQKLKKAELDVSENNTGARKLYEKLGYKVISEKKTPVYPQLPKVIRMSRPV